MNPAILRHGLLGPPGFRIELYYSLVVIVICTAIFLKTHKLYQLSSHKGLKYFRNTFLFFGLTYLFKIISRFLIFVSHDVGVLPFLLGFRMISIYASLAAVLYLAYSMVWKDLEKSVFGKEHILHSIAIALSLVSIFSGNAFVYIGAQMLIVAYVAVIGYSRWRKPVKKGKHKINSLYPPLVLFFVLNVLDIFVPNFLRTTQITINIVSVIIFIAVWYKLAKIGSGK